MLPLLSTLAGAYEGELGTPEAAIERNQAILAIAPSDPEAVGALERLYIATGRFPDLLAIYDKKLELAKSKTEELEIRFKLASLYEEEIKQPEKAIVLYQAILTQDAEQLPALIALDRILTGLGRWKELAATLTKEIDLTTDMGAIAELKFRRGALLEQHLSDRKGAVESYKEALSLEPEHEGAKTALQAYLSDRDLQMVAVEVLEPLYEQSEDTSRLVEVQRIRLNQEKNTGRRVALLLRIGALEAKLGNSEQAWEAYARAFTENPESTAAREALENLAAILDSWASLVTLYEGALGGKKALPPPLERELLLVVAVAYDEKLEKSEKAVEYFRRAQAIEPEDASALVALERLYTRTERWSDLIDTLTKKFALVKEPYEREQIRVRIATVWEEMLNNAPEAIKAWKAVLKDNAENVQALRSLDRLYLRAGDFRELGDNIQRQLKLTKDPDETIALLGRLGNLREKQLGEAGAAVETDRKILEIEPEHPDTLAALERILPNPEQELGVAQLLEPVYKARGDWPRLIAVYEIEARHDVETEQKIDAYKQSDDVYEVGLDDPDHAYEALGWALREDPQNSEVQGSRSSGSRARSSKLADLVGLYELAGVVGARRAPQERALSQDRAPLRGRPGDGRAGGRRVRGGAGRLAARRRRRPTRWSSSICAAATIPAWSSCCCARPTSSTPSSRRSSSTTRRRSSTKRSWRTSRRPSTSTARCSASTIRIRPRSITSSGSTSGCRAGRISRTSTARRPSWRRIRPRRSRCSSCWGRTTIASSTIRRGPSRPTRRSSISIRTTSTPPRRWIGCTSAPSAGTTSWPFSSARPRWRRPPPRWSACASAAASCGDII